MHALKKSILRVENENGNRMIGMRRAYNIMLSGGETKVNALKAAFRTQVFWNRHNTPELFKKYQKTFLTTDRLYGTKKYTLYTSRTIFYYTSLKTTTTRRKKCLASSAKSFKEIPVRRRSCVGLVAQK